MDKKLTIKTLHKIRQETELKLIEVQTLFNETVESKHKHHLFDKIHHLQNTLTYINSKIIVEQNQEILKQMKKEK
jgi:hypothetical protein